MHSVNAIAGVRQSLAGLQNIQEHPIQQVERIKQALETGKLDTTQLQERLEARFGEAAQGIVSDDGSVDFESLEALIIEHRTTRLEQKLEARFGERVDGLVGDGGRVDVEALSALRTAKLQERLESHFGEDAQSLVGEDGAIDFEGLVALLKEKAHDTPYALGSLPALFGSKA